MSSYMYPLSSAILVVIALAYLNGLLVRALPLRERLAPLAIPVLVIACDLAAALAIYDPASPGRSEGAAFLVGLVSLIIVGCYIALVRLVRRS